MQNTARIEPGRPSSVSSLPLARPYAIPAGARKWLDAMRAIAAFAVFSGHLRNIFFQDYNSLATPPNLFVKAIYFLTGFGSDAVTLFFVLSGVLVGGSVYRAMTTGTWKLSLYLMQRFVRLQMVVIPALLLGFFWDKLGMLYLGDSPVYQGAVGNILRGPVTDSMTWAIYLGNAGFLQMFFFPTAGSNAALWSLSYEFWSYVCFPAVLYAFATHTPVMRRLASIAVLTAVHLFIGSHFTNLFFIWLMGACVAQQLARPSQNSLLLQRAFPIFAWVAFLGTLVGFRVLGHVIGADKTSLIVGGLASAAVLALLLASRSTPQPEGKLERLVAKAAGFSFTLYACHLPPLFFLGAAFSGQQRWQPDAVHLAAGAGICLLVVLYSYAVSRLFEARTDSVRDWLTRKIFIPAKSAS